MQVCFEEIDRLRQATWQLVSPELVFGKAGTAAQWVKTSASSVQ